MEKATCIILSSIEVQSSSAIWSLQLGNLERAEAVMDRKIKSRFDVLAEIHSSGVCATGFGSSWYTKALQVLINNKVNLYYFACAMRQAIKKGRQQNINILIVGPTNCGKSFLLDPLEIVYKAFVNSACSKYGLG